MDESANWYQNIWTHSTIHSIKDLPSQLDLQRITAQHLRPYKSSQENHILSNQTKQKLQNYFLQLRRIYQQMRVFYFTHWKQTKNFARHSLSQKINIYTTPSATKQHTASNYNTAQQTLTVHIKLRYTK